jgi:hypothetical protein
MTPDTTLTALLADAPPEPERLTRERARQIAGLRSVAADVGNTLRAECPECRGAEERPDWPACERCGGGGQIVVTEENAGRIANLYRAVATWAERVDVERHDVEDRYAAGGSPLPAETVLHRVDTATDRVIATAAIVAARGEPIVHEASLAPIVALTAASTMREDFAAVLAVTRALGVEIEEVQP